MDRKKQTYCARETTLRWRFAVVRTFQRSAVAAANNLIDFVLLQQPILLSTAVVDVRKASEMGGVWWLLLLLLVVPLVLLVACYVAEVERSVLFLPSFGGSSRGILTDCTTHTLPSGALLYECPPPSSGLTSTSLPK